MKRSAQPANQRLRTRNQSHRFRPWLKALEDRMAPANLTVTSNLDDGSAGTLRDVINTANSNLEADTISFAIGTGAATITLTSALPPLTDAGLVINGQTQPGWVAAPIVQVVGGAFSLPGFDIQTSNVTIKGLVITNNTGGTNVAHGIQVGSTATGAVIEGNYIGINLAGTAAAANSGNGIYLNDVGGTKILNNVISGNTLQGIRIEGVNADGNIIQGNIIGLNALGTAKVANVQNGIFIHGGDNNIIGTNADGMNDTAERNVISGNTQNGIQIQPTGLNSVPPLATADNNKIRGNLIGLNLAGTAALGNSQNGILTNLVNGEGSAVPFNTQIGGPTVAERNIISGNSQSGFNASRFSSFGLIQNNYFGLDVTGSVKVANTLRGIYLNGADHFDIVGNVVSGNSSDGILLDNGAYQNKIRGNIVGLNAAGTAAIGNTSGGVSILSADGSSSNNNMVGGTTVADRNILSGNRDGVFIQDAGSRNNTVQGNYIGTDITGTVAIGNLAAGAGVRFSNGYGNRVLDNLISGNLSHGISVTNQGAPGVFRQIKWDALSGGNDHYYVVSPLKIGWVEAEAAAVKAGGHLISIGDSTEQSFVQTSVYTLAASSGSMFIGLNDIVTEGVFEWTDPTSNPPTYSNFNTPNEPNDFGGVEEYVEMTGTGLWNDVGPFAADRAGMEFTSPADLNLLMQLFYLPNVIQGNRIGEKAGGALSLPNSGDGIRITSSARTIVGTDGDGKNDAAEANVIVANKTNGISVFDSTSVPFAVNQWSKSVGGNDHYYVATGVSLTWADAERFAQSIGGHLVSIDSADENSFIARNFTTPLNADMWIGLTDLPLYGGMEFGNTANQSTDPLNPNGNGGNRGAGFVWIDGTTTAPWPAPPGFQAWNPGEPNNSTDENFTTITPAGGWNDLASGDSTGNTRRFIMEFNTLDQARAVATKLGFETTIAGNFIGVQNDGMTVSGNVSIGLNLDTAAGVTVRNNVIVGSGNDGVRLADNSVFDVIENNKIGVRSDGVTTGPNVGRGVAVTLASGSVVRNNTIGGSGSDAVQINARSRANWVYGNNIGVGSDGKSVVGNTGKGIVIAADAANNIIGSNLDGTNDGAERNIIAGNQGGGIAMTALPLLQWTTGTGANNHYYIINNVSATWVNAEAFAVSLGGHLVSIGDANEQTFVTSTVRPFYGNTANLWIGFTDNEAYGGQEFGAATANNGEGWVWVDGTPPPYPVGGPLTGYKNWNAGEPNDGGGNEDFAEMSNAGGWNDINDTSLRASMIEFASTPDLTPALRSALGAGPNFFYGNYIGVASDGTTLVPNNGDGLSVANGALAIVGNGTAAGANLIAGNTGAGVVVTGDGGTATVRNNRIYSNGGLGIDLGNNGVTLNDANDVDVGPNGLLNFPVITGVTTGGTTSVSGTYQGLASASLTIEFFANTANDSSLYGEGQRSLGTVMITTDAMGNATFSAPALGATVLGEFISAVAIDADGNTSEFSKSFPTAAVAPPTINGPIVIAGGSQRSLVKDIKITFSEAVTIGAGAFALKGYALGPIGDVELNVGTLVGNTVTITFKTGGAGFITLDPGLSLPDGQYELTIDSSKITGAGGNLDGNKNGTYDGAADNVSSKLHRLFGDSNGDGAITAADFNAFRLDYGLVGASIFDFDNSGSITAADFNTFRLRYGLSGYLP